MLRQLTLSLTARNSSTSDSAPVGDSAVGTGAVATLLQAADSVSGAGHHGESSVFHEADTAFEGDSSMAAHSVFASEFLHNAVTRTSFRMHNPEMESALESLRQIVAMQNSDSKHESRFESVKPMPKGGFRDLPMPPMQAVVSLLRDMKGKLPLSAANPVC